VVSCHYTGRRQFRYGKGLGQKCDDMATAWLCGDCHRYFDEYEEMRYRIMAIGAISRVEVSEEFLNCIMLTNIERLKRGFLKV